MRQEARRNDGWTDGWMVGVTRAMVDGGGGGKGRKGKGEWHIVARREAT